MKAVYIINTIIFFILVSIPLSAMVRFIGCIFSSNLRKRVKSRPILHAIWAIVSVLLIVSAYFAFMQFATLKG